MNQPTDDEFARQLRRSLQGHTSQASDDLADAAIRRAGQRRRRRQAAAGVLGLALVGGIGTASLHLGRHADTAAPAGRAVSAAPSTPQQAKASPNVPACTETNAAWSVDKDRTENGITTYLVRVRPMTSAACRVSGVPAFWLVDTDNTIIGSAAVRAEGTSAPVVVATEKHPAEAAVRYDTTLARGATCRPASGQVRMFAPGGSIPMGAPTTITGCRNADVKLFGVTAFVAG